ncbi:unnamed protein product, partial [marine sediment metagenome]
PRHGADQFDEAAKFARRMICETDGAHDAKDDPLRL